MRIRWHSRENIQYVISMHNLKREEKKDENYNFL